MKKTVFTVLYLMVATTVVFYWPKIVAEFGKSGGETPRTLAEESRMDEGAYFALREVASVRVGYVLISYELDEETGLCSKRFTNAACPNIQAERDQLLAYQKKQQAALHEQVLLLSPLADEDGSGFVDEAEGAQFRDVFELGHLAFHCFGQDEIDPSKLAIAAGLEPEETVELMQKYLDLQLSEPAF